LREILQPAGNATFDPDVEAKSSFCLPETRSEVLKEIKSWADGHDKRHIFWLYGMAGTGKSTIARTVVRDYVKGRLCATFFFSKGGGDASHARKFFRSIAWQLAKVSSSLSRYICDAIAEDSDIVTRNLRHQWNKLILQPLYKMKPYSNRPSLIFVIDALDECEGDGDVRTILELFAEVKGLDTINLRIFITSRPEMPILCRFRAMNVISYRDLALHDISRATVNRDLSAFFRERFRQIALERGKPVDSWPGSAKISLLVERADGLFIYAATVCRFVSENSKWPAEDLLEVFAYDGTRHSTKRKLRIPSKKSPTQGLDKIYAQILDYTVKDEEQETEDDDDQLELAKEYKLIIGSLAVLSEPLSAIALGELLSIDRETVTLRLDHLRSVLNVPQDERLPVRLLHPSFRDFLFDKQRCQDDRFWIDQSEATEKLANCCLKLMSENLKSDICGLQAPGVLLGEIGNNRIQKHLPPELQYACRYWVQHFQQSRERKAVISDNGCVHAFLKTHLLYWLEALGLLGKASEGVLAIASLESMVLVSGLSILKEVLDALTATKNLKLIRSSRLSILKYQNFCMMRNDLSLETDK
jgi:hypothetical protein